MLIIPKHWKNYQMWGSLCVALVSLHILKDTLITNEWLQFIFKDPDHFSLILTV